MSKIKSFLNSAGKEFIYGGHLFALNAVSIILMSAILLNIPVTWDILLSVYLIFYSIYSYDHFNGAKKNDYLTNLERALYLKDKRKIPLLISGSILTSVLILLYFSNILILFFSLVILFLGLFYGSYFKKITRKIIAFKDFFVSFVWMILVFFLVCYYSYPLTLGVFLLASFIFLKMLIIQIFFDIRDIEGDKDEKLLTLPVIFGRNKALYILRLISVLPALMVFFYSYFNILPDFSLFLILALFFNFYYLGEHQYLKGRHYPYLLAASEPILWLFLVLFGKFLLC